MLVNWQLIQQFSACILTLCLFIAVKCQFFNGNVFLMVATRCLFNQLIWDLENKINNQTPVSECFGWSLQLHTYHLSLLTNLVFMITSMLLLLFCFTIEQCFHIVNSSWNVSLCFPLHHHGKLRRNVIKLWHLVFCQLWTTKSLRGIPLPVN